METVTVRGNNSFLKIALVEVFDFPERTSPFGGYDVEGNLEVESGGFKVKDKFFFTTSDLYKFYNQLKPAYKKINGEASFSCYDKNLKFNVIFQADGSVIISGAFNKTLRNSENSLEFKFSSDQTYLKQTLVELEAIVNKYGNEKGVL